MSIAIGLILVAVAVVAMLIMGIVVRSNALMIVSLILAIFIVVTIMLLGQALSRMQIAYLKRVPISGMVLSVGINQEEYCCLPCAGRFSTSIATSSISFPPV